MPTNQAAFGAVASRSRCGCILSADETRLVRTPQWWVCDAGSTAAVINRLCKVAVPHNCGQRLRYGTNVCSLWRYGFISCASCLDSFECHIPPSFLQGTNLQTKDLFFILWFIITMFGNVCGIVKYTIKETTSAHSC